MLRASEMNRQRRIWQAEGGSSREIIPVVLSISSLKETFKVERNDVNFLGGGHKSRRCRVSVVVLKPLEIHTQKRHYNTHNDS